MRSLLRRDARHRNRPCGADRDVRLIFKGKLAYGYGKLDRFDKDGVTQFFQARFLTRL
jgi:hypothetical protein